MEGASGREHSLLHSSQKIGKNWAFQPLSTATRTPIITFWIYLQELEMILQTKRMFMQIYWKLPDICSKDNNYLTLPEPYFFSKLANTLLITKSKIVGIQYADFSRKNLQHMPLTVSAYRLSRTKNYANWGNVMLEVVKASFDMKGKISL